MRKKIIVISIFIFILFMSLFLFSEFQFKNSVTIKLLKKSISGTGATVVVTDKSSQKYTWGTEYFLQVKENGKWKKLDFLEPSHSPANVDILLGYILDEKDQFTQSIDWERRYGKLPNGTYRIVKIGFNTTTRKDVYFYSNEFKIK